MFNKLPVFLFLLEIRKKGYSRKNFLFVIQAIAREEVPKPTKDIALLCSI